MSSRLSFRDIRIFYLAVAIFFCCVIQSAPISGSENSSQTGRTTLVYGVPPEAHVVYPDWGELINGTIYARGTATDIEGNDTIRKVEFYARKVTCYFNYGTTFIANDTYDGDINYSVLWVTTAFGDSNYYYLVVKAYDDEFDDDDVGGRFTVNNVDEEPTWNEFRGNLSTNLTALDNASQLNDYIYVYNLQLGIFNVGSINWSGQTVNVDGEALDAYIEIKHGKVAMDSCGLPYLEKPAIITIFNLSIVTPILLKNSVECDVCSLINYSNSTLRFSVSSLSSSENWVEFSVRDNLSLDIWDETDAKGGNNTRYRNENVLFFANYTSSGGILPRRNETNCFINFNVSGNVTGYLLMNYSTASNIFYYSRSFSLPGTYFWRVTCNSTLFGYYGLNATDNLTIPNRPPVLLYNIPDVTLFWNTISTGMDLDAYFSDPDNDILTYDATDVSNIQILINDTTHMVTFIPATNWYGTRLVKFTATDPYNATATSNDVLITVIQYVPPPPTAGAGAGGGAMTVFEEYCRPDYNCTLWGYCQYKFPALNEYDFMVNWTGFQTHDCVDLNDCGFMMDLPEILRGCIYIPTCSDSIQNQGETGVDCGGPCPACPTCFDGIQNQGEAGIDCGGPCKPCPFEEKPAVKPPRVGPPEFEKGMIAWWIILTSVVAGAALFSYFSRSYVARLMEMLSAMLAPPKPEKVISYEEIRSSTLRRISLLERKVGVASTATVASGFYTTMRGFFRTSFRMEYEFTYQELAGELTTRGFPTGTAIIVTNFMTKLVEMEYGTKPVDTSLLREMLHNAKDVVNHVVAELSKAEEAVKESKKTKKIKKI